MTASAVSMLRDNRTKTFSRENYIFLLTFIMIITAMLTECLEMKLEGTLA